MASAKIPRRKLAAYAADEILAGRNPARPLAAYLLESKRANEVDLLVRDIEAAMQDRGVLYAEVESSHKINDSSLESITKYLKSVTGAKQITLRESVDESLLGGVKINTPDKQLDATLRHRINQLSASKI